MNTAREARAAYVPDGDLARFARDLPRALKEDFTGTMKRLRDAEFQEALLRLPRRDRSFVRSPTWAEKPGCLQASSFLTSSWEMTCLSRRLLSSRSRQSRISRSASHFATLCQEPSGLRPPSLVIRCRCGCH